MYESLLLHFGTFLSETYGRRYMLWPGGSIHVFPACGEHFQLDDLDMELHDLTCPTCPSPQS